MKRLIVVICVCWAAGCAGTSPTTPPTASPAPAGAVSTVAPALKPQPQSSPRSAVLLSPSPAPASAMATRAPAAAPLASTSPLPTATLSPSPAPATAAATASPASAPAGVHTTFPSGLTLDEYALQAPPSLDPLVFAPVQGTMADIVARHEKDGGDIAWTNDSFDEQGHYTLSTTWNGQPLTASEVLGMQPHPVRVEVRRGPQRLMIVDTGDPSPVTTLRVLLAHDYDWFLEVAHVREWHDAATGNLMDTVNGQIVEDGVLLNSRDGYQSAFGLQLLRGQPFYFYQQAGRLGFAYAGQRTPLRYDAMSHYGCCSGAELNPRPRENMVAFFAQKGAVWYYVEIGKYGP